MTPDEFRAEMAHARRVGREGFMERLGAHSALPMSVLEALGDAYTSGWDDALQERARFGAAADA